MHAFLTRKMVENRGLLDHIPFAVDRIDNGNLIYEPIPYPETVYVVWSVFYVLGGEQLLKLSCIFFAALTALCVFLLLRDIDRYVGFFAGFCVIVLGTLRFIMTPLIEQVLLSASFFTILFYYRSLKTQKLRYFLLTGVFLGFAVSVKQQGLLLFGVMFLHGLATFGYRMIRNRKLRDIAPLLIILTFSILVGAFPIYEQLTRNGTIMPSGSFEFLPFYPAIEKFFQPKVPIDYEADMNLSKMLFTEQEVRKGMTLDNVAQQYFLFPVLYARSAVHYPIDMSLLFFSLALPLYLCGGLFLAKKDKQLFLLLLSVFFMEFLSTIFLKAAVFKYNMLGLSIIAIFLVTGVYKIKNLLQGLPKGRTPNFLLKKLSMIFVFFVLVILVMGNLIFVFPNWRDEGRQTDAYLRAYSELKTFIEKSSIPPAAIFLAPQGNFIFICERDALWISSYGGAMVPTIFETENQTEALYWLQHYNISFIVIDTNQLQRKTLYDYIPEHGLMDYINNSSYFEKVFTYPSKEELLVLYRVIYAEG